MEEVIVTVEQGKLQGKIEKDELGNPFYSFEGVPYAKPPIGPLRFKDPQPPEPWTGIKEATGKDSMCFSSHFILDEQQLKMAGSEDCLHLNIFTHEISKNTNNKLKPVMVFVPGGGFVTGSSTRHLYGPERLMIEDVVLITFNYRIGALGFLSIEDSAIGSIANAGMKDMIAALKWIQKNVKQFGGDPNNVTIFGQSAGSAAVHYLVLSPMAKGLFHKAILQSGCALHSWARGDKHNAEKLAKALGCHEKSKKKIFEFLQTLPVEKLIEGQEILGDHLDVSAAHRYFSPTIDKKFLPDEPFKLLKSGHYNKVPLMVGYVTRETLALDFFRMMVRGMDIRSTDRKCLIPHFLEHDKESDTHDEISGKIVEYYFKSKEINPHDDAFHQMATDNYYLREINRTVRLHVKTSSQPLYYFRVSAETQLNVIKLIMNINAPGVAHADELGYLFKCAVATPITPGSIEDKLFRQFTKMWANFATYGNPTPSPNDELLNVEWKPVKPGEMHYLDIGKELVLDKNPEHERIQFWGEICKYKK